MGAPCRFAVLPDFFGDDIVVDASTLSVSRAELPSENFLLSMLPGGEAIVMSVSESRDNDIEISLSDATPREIAYAEISYGKKPHIWIAVLRDKGIWHQRSVALADAGKVIDLDWKMPFAALWRVDWSTADKLNDSWEMLLQKPDGEYAMQAWFGQDPTEGQSFGEKLGARDWNKPDRKRWNPVLSTFVFPCWVDSEGRGHLQPLAERRYTNGGKIYNFSGPAVIYPLDRATTAPFSTPIDKLTIVDLVRMTLGVGPCQYILDLEGQKGNSRGVATCYARDVINAIYKEGTQLKHGPEIDEQLDAAVAFIRNVRGRIDQYVAFGHEMRVYLNEQKRLQPEHAEFLDELLLVNGRLDEFLDANREQIRTPAEAEDAAAGFRKELLTYTGNDAYAKCEARMRAFTSIGGAQDGLVAACRMIVKTLRQRGTRHGRERRFEGHRNRNPCPHSGDLAKPHRLRSRAALIDTLERDERSQHSDFKLKWNLSMCEWRFGLMADNRTGFTSVSSRIVRNASLKLLFLMSRVKVPSRLERGSLGPVNLGHLQAATLAGVEDAAVGDHEPTQALGSIDGPEDISCPLDMSTMSMLTPSRKGAENV